MTLAVWEESGGQCGVHGGAHNSSSGKGSVACVYTGSQRDSEVLSYDLLKTFLFLLDFILVGCRNIEHFV